MLDIRRYKILESMVVGPQKTAWFTNSRINSRTIGDDYWKSTKEGTGPFK